MGIIVGNNIGIKSSTAMSIEIGIAVGMLIGKKIFGIVIHIVIDIVSSIVIGIVKHSHCFTAVEIMDSSMIFLTGKYGCSRHYYITFRNRSTPTASSSPAVRRHPRNALYYIVPYYFKL